MNEQEFDNILCAAVEATGVDRYKILNDKTRNATNARGLVAYIIKEYYPHLILHLSERTCRTRAAIYTSASIAYRHAQKHRALGKSLDKMIHILKLIPRKTESESQNNPTPQYTKRLFGFDYTDEEELRYKRAKDEASSFWDRMSGIGRAPLEAGMVFPLKGVSRSDC